MDPISEALALSGTTADVSIVEHYYAARGYVWDGSPIPRAVIYEVAADLADREAARLTTTVGVTQVEDISVDRGKARQGWWDLAARLRAMAAEMDDDGPLLVHRRDCWPEATEHG